MSKPYRIISVNIFNFSSLDWALNSRLVHGIFMKNRPRLAIVLRFFGRILIIFLCSFDLSRTFGNTVIVI